VKEILINNLAFGVAHKEKNNIRVCIYIWRDESGAPLIFYTYLSTFGEDFIPHLRMSLYECGYADETF